MTQLDRYRAKRDFQQTAEPSGEQPITPSDRLRFVIQKHDATRLHFDLRLELDGVFKSWAVTRGPSLDPADKRLAVEVEDHPLGYGDFEGTIPKGQYGGGTVQIWDRGYWAPEGGLTPQQAFDGGDLKFHLEGERLHGSWVLVRMKHDRMGTKRTNWLLIKHRDEFAGDGTEAMMAEDRSVASSRPMAEIAAGRGRAPRPFMLSPDHAPTADAVWNSKEGLAAEARGPAATPPKSARKPKPAKPHTPATPAKTPKIAIPDFVAPQLCQTVERPPAGAGWAHEIKFDGYRMQLRVTAGTATLRTRNGHDWTARFPAIARAAAALPDLLADGEIVAHGPDGTPDFAALQVALSEEHTDDLVFYAFDLIFDAGTDWRPRHLADRKTRLQQILTEARAPTTLRFVEHFETGGDAILQSACRMSLEGIVSKRLDAPYQSGRTDNWVRSKCRGGEEVVIGAWSTTAGKFRSLLVGAHRGDHFVYLGRVGTGYAAGTVAKLMPRLESVASKTSPFTGANAPKREPGVTWTRPELVAEIEFAGWTGAGMVRQAAFKGLRQDKPAAEVQAAEPIPPADAPSPTPKPPPTPAPASRPSTTAKPVVLGVTLSHPDKQFWPDAGDGEPVTKLDLARYFEAVGPRMIPHLAGRPCSIVRAPDGLAGQAFFQRHAMTGTSHLLDLVTVSGDRKPYLQVNRVEGLAALAQSGAVELHPTNCAPLAYDQPGRLVFDLDPGPGVTFDTIAAAARSLRDRLDAIGLPAFCKTTGGKGLHVVCPLAPPTKGDGPDWKTAKSFAQELCRRLAADEPGRFVLNMAKKLRDNRIFLDYLRNDHLSTAVSPFSPRHREGATVSMPVAWREVTARLDPKSFTVRTVPKLLARKDPWADYDASARPLAEAIERLARTAG